VDILERPATVTQSQRIEIEAQRQATHETRRTTVPAMEALLYQPIPILDHGFIRVIDYMGDDAAVVQAARVSYGAGTKKIREDAGLINYLMRHRHTSPFEMCEVKLHMKLPIFVARQQIRTRTAAVNEYSARYSILDREFYMPEPEQLGAQAKSNRQGRGDTLTGDEARRVMELLREDATRSYDHYEEMLNETATGDTLDPDRSGLARELARMNLSVNFYTQWYWKIDLHNLLHFLKLRGDAHAQYEIRAYAEAMLDIVKQWVPLTHAAFMDYRMGAYELSAKGLAAVRRLLRGEPVDRESTGMSPGEWRELMETLER
jgi:thymidylate synthase (FAD)